jgi:uncharacterized protein YbaR (Trm112 family)
MDRLPLSLLRCPQCAVDLNVAPSTECADCTGCPLSYPVRDEAPVLVISEATARPIATDPEFERLVAEAVAAPFLGWDWSWLEGRRSISHDPAGDVMALYDARARELVATATAVLDLGTGGGERLANYAPLAPVAVATEAHAPECAGRRRAPQAPRRADHPERPGLPGLARPPAWQPLAVSPAPFRR